METQTVEGQQAISGYLADLWKRILGRDVDPEADFFESGGNSLSAIRMIMEVQSTYNVELDLETFFEEPTVANLTATILGNTNQGVAG